MFCIFTAIVALLTISRTDNASLHFPVGDQTAVTHTALAAEEADHSGDLDFWVGEWSCAGEMRGANGKVTATRAENSVSKILDGNVVQERFKMKGLNGLSVSAYNKTSGRWQQTWVDNQGSYIALIGGNEGNEVILTTSPTASQPQRLNRMVFTNIGASSFDWNWEASVDGAKTWQKKWHLHYTRKPASQK